MLKPSSICPNCGVHTWEGVLHVCHPPTGHPEASVYYDFPRPATCLRDVIHHLNYNKANAMKYIYRAGRKDVTTEIKDLEKAKECIEDEIRRLKNK